MTIVHTFIFAEENQLEVRSLIVYLKKKIKQTKKKKKIKDTNKQTKYSKAMFRSHTLDSPSAQLHQLNNEKPNCLQAIKAESAPFHYSSWNTNLHSNDGVNVTLSPELSHYYAAILNSPID